MKKIIWQQFSCLFLFSACALASSPSLELDEALKEYTQWETIQVNVEQGSNLTSMRSDGGYKTLLANFVLFAESDYAEANNWLAVNNADIPSPLYWAMAYVASKHKQPNTEVFKWLSIAQTTGRYDIARCKDATASAAYDELFQANEDLFIPARNNFKEYLRISRATLDELKKSPYHASPMWVCSSGMAAFKFDNTDQPLPVSYNELVKLDPHPEKSWIKFIDATKNSLIKVKD